MEFNQDALRAGQRQAIQMIEQRVRRGEKTTAIVLPCRYGKSDTARLAMLKLWDEGVSGVGLALSPNTTLRGQLASTAKWDAALQRYQVKVQRPVQIAEIDAIKTLFNSNDELFWSLTTHLATSNKTSLTQWIEHKTHTTKLPVVVFIDECHTGSEENKWGDLVPAFTAAGAHVVLLTATPDRADGSRIPGFEFKTIESEEVTVYRCSDGSTPEMVRIDVLAGVKEHLRLVPDVEVTFEEAWDIDVLCKVARNPFDVDLRTVKGLEEEHEQLSELKPSRSREVLGSIVREPKVIREGCQRLVSSLRVRRQAQPTVQAVVYCANDQGNGGANGHARAIKRELKKLDPALAVVIATSADGDGAAVLQDFIDGIGDVLIVKQMAGVGLDIGPLKIGLDLSPTRTYASFVQRMMRPATPHNGIMAMEWISPDDVVSAAYFEKLVKNQGGEAAVSDLSPVDSYEQRRKAPDERPAMFVDGTCAADFNDSGSNRALREEWDPVGRLAAAVPGITNLYTHAELAARLKASGLEIVEKDIPAAVTRNTGEEAASIRADLNARVKELVGWEMRRRGYDYSQYGRVTEQWWADAKIEARWPHNTKLDECNDLAALGRMLTILETWVANMRGDSEAS